MRGANIFTVCPSMYPLKMRNVNSLVHVNKEDFLYSSSEEEEGGFLSSFDCVICFVSKLDACGITHPGRPNERATVGSLSNLDYNEKQFIHFTWWWANYFSKCRWKMMSEPYHFQTHKHFELLMNVEFHAWSTHCPGRESRLSTVPCALSDVLQQNPIS